MGGCHFLLQGIFPNTGIEPVSPALAGGFFTAEPPGKPSSSLEVLAPVSLPEFIFSCWAGWEDWGDIKKKNLQRENWAF